MLDLLRLLSPRENFKPFVERLNRLVERHAQLRRPPAACNPPPPLLLAPFEEPKRELTLFIGIGTFNAADAGAASYATTRLNERMSAFE